MISINNKVIDIRYLRLQSLTEHTAALLNMHIDKHICVHANDAESG
jgi:hypothetical protein